MGVYCLSLQMVVRTLTCGSIACLCKRWSEPGHGGLLPVFTNGGQSSDMEVYCLSLQMLVRARTWGSIACLYKCWSEAGHGGLLPVFTNGGQSSDMGVYCLSLQTWSEPGHGGLLSCLYNIPSIANFNTSTSALNKFILFHFNIEYFDPPV